MTGVSGLSQDCKAMGYRIVDTSSSWSCLVRRGDERLYLAQEGLGEPGCLVASQFGQTARQNAESGLGEGDQRLTPALKMGKPESTEGSLGSPRISYVCFVFLV